MAKYYYNGVLLPGLPADTLANYPYAFIRTDNKNARYNAVFSATPWYYNGDLIRTTVDGEPYYNIDFANIETAEEWTFYKNSTSDFTIDDQRICLWSNRDIPNGAPASEDIWFYASEPILDYDKKFLIRSGSILYTITDGALSALAETEVTASLFQTCGMDEIPYGALLATLTDPEVLYWQDSEDELPTFSLTVKGTPPLPQMFTSEPMDLAHESIAGIDHASVDASEDVRFAISFDDGASWQAFDGSAWFNVSDTAPGMLASTMNAITAEQWAEAVVLESYMLRFWLPNVTAFVKSVVIHYINP